MSQLRISVKRIVDMLVSFVALALGLCICVLPSNKPPREKKLIENFYEHRAAYERLRHMLQEDEQLLRVASWGVETTNSVGIREPPEGDLSVNRYNEYLALLRETGAKWGFRSRGERSECAGVLLWGGGRGGNTRHVGLYWTDHKPDNQVASLDDYYRNPKRPRDVFRHIDGNWYLYADW